MDLVLFLKYYYNLRNYSKLMKKNSVCVILDEHFDCIILKTILLTFYVQGQNFKLRYIK